MSKSFTKLSDESITLLIKRTIKKICGVSAIMVAKKKSLFCSLKKTPEIFFKIYGTPGINLKIIKRKNELFLTVTFSMFLSVKFLNFLAKRYEIVEPMLNDITERIKARFSNIKVDNINIGIIIPNKQIHKIEKKR